MENSLSLRKRPRKSSFMAFLDRNALLASFAFIYASLLSYFVLPVIEQDYKAVATIRFAPAKITTQQNLQPVLEREASFLRSASFLNTASQSTNKHLLASNKNIQKDPAFKHLNVDAAHFNEIEPAAGFEDDIISFPLEDEDFESIIIERKIDKPIIEISYISSNPKKAAKKANQYALSYLEHHYQENQKHKKLVKAPVKQESSLERGLIYTRLTNYLNGAVKMYWGEEDRMSLIAFKEQIALLSRQEQELKSKIEAYAAQREKDSAKGASSTSPELTRLSRAQKADKRKLSALSGRYGYKHPKIIALKEKIVQKSMAIKKKRAAATANNRKNLDEYDAKIKELGQQHEWISQQASALKQISSSKVLLQEKQLKQLQFVQHLISGLAPPQSGYWEAHFQTVNDSASSEGLPYTVDIESFADVPATPHIPRKEIAVGFIMVVTLILLLFVIAFKQKARALRYFSSDDIEYDTDLDCMASIPDVTKACNVSHLEKTRTPHPDVEKVLSALSLKLDSKFEKRGKGGYVVTLTSSISNEGKTQTLLWLGRIYANAGKRVVIVDGNFREPNLHEATGRGNTTSIIDYLTQKKTLNEIIHMNERLGIDMIFSQKTPENANRLLSSSKMSDFIDDLKRRYDVILIDTPSCLTYADVLVFAKLSDQILYNVRYGKTKRESVIKGIKQIQNALKTPVSFILAQIDTSDKSEFHYI